jgi:hypothetical protein
MAPKSNTKAAGTSRIRFIMFDAEIADDQIQSVTQAITSALRGPPGSPPVKRIAAIPANGAFAEPQEIEGEAEEIVESDVAEAAPARPRVNAQRKPAPTPEVLELDLTSDVSLASYVAQHKFESHLQRYLIAAAWYHDHRSTAKVTSAHIYTAYRFLKWPLTVKDFAQPLRGLKAGKVFGSSEKGTYTINHLGLQRVAEMKTGAGD